MAKALDKRGIVRQERGSDGKAGKCNSAFPALGPSAIGAMRTSRQRLSGDALSRSASAGSGSNPAMVVAQAAAAKSSSSPPRAPTSNTTGRTRSRTGANRVVRNRFVFILRVLQSQE